MMKNNSGVTLIALVITIIVLLILAGVSIATLMGPNGIITNAKKADKDTTTGAIIEKINTGLAPLQIQVLTGEELDDNDLKALRNSLTEYTGYSVILGTKTPETEDGTTPQTLTKGVIKVLKAGAPLPVASMSADGTITPATEASVNQ